MPQSEIVFSIVTASFNSGTKLLATYASIQSQPVQFEYLIMDGGSTDGSQQLGQKLAAEDSRVRFLSEKDNGIYDALNKSIPLARGRYLYFIGAGDLLMPSSLLEISPYLPQQLNAFVYGDCMRAGQRYLGEFNKVALTDQNICHQAIFYGRDVFGICGVYNCKYPIEADWDFNLRCFGNRRIRRIYAPVIVAEFEPGGVSSRYDEKFRADIKQAIRRHLGLYMHLYLKLRAIYHPLRQKFIES